MDSWTVLVWMFVVVVFHFNFWTLLSHIFFNKIWHLFSSLNEGFIFYSFHLRVRFERLYGAMPSLPPDLEPVIWAGIDSLTNIAPEGQSLSHTHMQTQRINRSPYTYILLYAHSS